MSAKSSNSQKGLKQRVIQNNLNLTESQLSSTYDEVTHQLVTFQSVAAPQFGSPISYKISDKNISLNDTSLQFLMSPITGVTGGVRMTNGHGLYSRAEFKINSVIQETVYGVANHITTQVMNTDSDRLVMNNAAGNYASIPQRLNNATKITPLVIPLCQMFNISNYPVLTSAHELEVVVYMNTLADCVVLSSGSTGTPVCSILQSNLLCKTSRFPQWLAESRLANMIENPEDSIFHSIRTTRFTAQSGLTNAIINLNFLTGASVAGLFFVSRQSSKLTGDGNHTFAKVSSFSLRDATNVSITGSQEITDDMAQNLALFWSESTYQTENSTGATASGVVQDTGANVYFYSHSSNLCSAVQRGRLLGARRYAGQETLQITFPSALAVSHEIDIYALTECVLRQGANLVQKLEIPSLIA